ncbi:hypothetical protein ACPYIV_05070 [Parabacteroides sp. ASD2025]|uniref:hypothetical protein n=1 Tax=Parabacteroides sp. ASD2025 TaxID=3415987 RepID=UPI003CF56394
MEIDQTERDKRYNFWARRQPAYISLVVPFIFILIYYNENQERLSDVKYVVSLLLSLTGVVTSLFFFLSVFIRDMAKFILEKLLWYILGTPTTNLLYDDCFLFTVSRKKDIRKKIKDSLSIDLESISDKSKKNEEYKRRVNEAVERIREVTRPNAILFEYECIYGFYRNMAAAFLLDDLFIVLPIYMYCICYPNTLPYDNGNLIFIGGVLIVLMILCIVLAYINGVQYAKKLYVSFLSLD